MCKNRLRINEFKTPLGFTDIKQRPAVVKEVCWQRILMVMQQANGWCIVPCRSLKKNGRCSQAEPRDSRHSGIELVNVLAPKFLQDSFQELYFHIFNIISTSNIFQVGLLGRTITFSGMRFKTRSLHCQFVFVGVSTPQKKS